MVGQHIFLCNRPHWKLGAIIITHHCATAIRPSSKFIVFAAVDLHLLLIEAVPEITRWHGVGEVQAISSVNLEWFVGQMLGLLFGDGWCGTLCC